MNTQTQSVTGLALLEYDTVLFDPASAYSPIDYSFTAPIAGYYRVRGSVRYTGQGTDVDRNIGVRRNNVFVQELARGNSFTSTVMSGELIIYLAQGDKITTTANTTVSTQPVDDAAYSVELIGI